MSPLWQDAKKLFRLLLAFEIEVVLADDVLGIAHLNRGFADGAKLRNEHRDEGVPRHVMGEGEFLGYFFTDVLEIRRDDRESLQRISLQPGGEVRLNRDVAGLAHFRDFAVNAD